MKKLATLALAILVGASGMALAADRDKTLTATGLIGEQWYDSNRREDHSSVVNLGFGYNFNTTWGSEITFQFAKPQWRTGGSDTPYKAEEVKINASALYHFDKGDALVPYLAGGLGVRNTNNPNNSSESSDFPTVNVGGGLKYFFTDNIAARVDARYYWDTEDDNGYNGNDFAVLAGIHVIFGAPEKPAPKAEPKPVPMAPVAPVDSDGDCVPYDRDKCPNTPKGVQVDKDGCPIVKPAKRMEIKIEFDFDKAVIRPDYHATLGDVAEFMDKYPNAVATIEGHTDSTGPEGYNQGLSEQRANAVRDFLSGNKKIDANRLKTVGYGETRPIADNGTRDGRQRNRRVIGVIIETR